MRNILQFLRQSKNFLIPFTILLGPAMWSIVLVLLKISPFGLCIEFESGKIPYQAQEHVVQQIIEKTLAKDYEWLTKIGNKKVAQELISLQPEISKNYTIYKYHESYLELGTSYHHYIRFDDSRHGLYLTLFGTWPRCPDFNVTEQEIYQHIKLDYATRWSSWDVPAK